MSDLQVKVRVLEAYGLAKTDKVGGSDPFVVAKFRGLGKMMTSVQTSVIHNTSNPVWNQDLTLYPKTTSDVLLLKVYDHDTLSKDNLLGMVEVPLERFFQQGTTDQWVQLMRRKGSWKSLIGGHPTWFNCPGQLHVQLWFGLSSQATGVQSLQSTGQSYNSGCYGQQQNFGTKEAQTFTTGFNIVQAPAFGLQQQPILQQQGLQQQGFHQPLQTL